MKFDRLIGGAIAFELLVEVAGSNLGYSSFERRVLRNFLGSLCFSFEGSSSLGASVTYSLGSSSSDVGSPT